MAKAPRFALVGRSGFRRRAQARAREVQLLLEELVRSSVPEPDLLHRLHRELRRARLDVRVLERGDGRDERERLVEAERILAELASRTGRVRDRDVSGQLLRRLAARQGGMDPAKVRALAERLRQEALEERKGLQASARLALEDGAHALPTYRLPSVTGPRPTSTALEAIFQKGARKELRARERELGRRLRKAEGRPTVRRLHQLRIALRRWRNVRFALALHPSSADTAPAWRRLQKALGEHHDLGILCEWVDAVPPELKGGGVRRAIRGRLARRQRSVEKMLHQDLVELRRGARPTARPARGPPRPRRPASRASAHPGAR